MRIGASLLVGAIAAILAAPATSASAAAVRTFVSGKGADSGSCSLVAPCRTFTFALAATSANGEIVVLDSAGYGAVTIAKPVTISNQTGVEGGITVNSGDAVTVSLASPGTVTLKGLTIDGSGTAGNGIVMPATTAMNTFLNIQNCTVRNFAVAGLNFQNAPAAGITNVLVTDSAIVANGDGIWYDPQPGGALAGYVSHTLVTGNAGRGIKITGTTGTLTLLVTDSEIIRNVVEGVNVGGTSAAINVTFRNSVIRLNTVADLNVVNANAGTVFFDHNYVSNGNNAGNMSSDGTNNLSVSGNAPALTPPH